MPLTVLKMTLIDFDEIIMHNPLENPSASHSPYINTIDKNIVG